MNSFRHALGRPTAGLCRGIVAWYAFALLILMVWGVVYTAAGRPAEGLMYLVLPVPTMSCVIAGRRLLRRACPSAINRRHASMLRAEDAALSDVGQCLTSQAYRSLVTMVIPAWVRESIELAVKVLRSVVWLVTQLFERILSAVTSCLHVRHEIATTSVSLRHFYVLSHTLILRSPPLLA